MPHNVKRAYVVLGTFVTAMFLGAATALASEPTPASVITTQGASLKTEGVALLVVVVPIAVFFMLVRKGLGWIGVRKGRTV
jgi:hypothetical protein